MNWLKFTLDKKWGPNDIFFVSDCFLLWNAGMINPYQEFLARLGVQSNKRSCGMVLEGAQQYTYYGKYYKYKHGLDFG